MNIVQLQAQSGPHLSHHETTFTVQVDVLIALLPLVGMAYYYYGVRSLFLILIGAGTCWITDLLCALMTRRKVDVRDVSPLITGLILSLMLPAAAPYWMPIVGGVFAVALVKQAFGGLGNNIFNPAAGGVAFLSICFPAQMFSYSAPFASLELWTNEVSATLQQSPANMLKYGGMPSLTTMDLVLGNFAGPMGTTNLLVMVACLLFLLVRKAINFRIPLTFTLTVATFSYLFPRLSSSPAASVLYECFAGMVLFAGFFMATDPVTAPKTKAGKYIFGFGCGLFTMLFQYFGAFELGAPFALLLMNTTSMALDRMVMSLRFGWNRPRLSRSTRLPGYRRPPKPM